ITAAPGISERDVYTAALLSSAQDETPEGRSIVELARERLGTIDAEGGLGDEPGFQRLSNQVAEFLPFKAESRTSGAQRTDGHTVLKGAVDAIAKQLDGPVSSEMQAATDRIAGLGATPLAIRRDGVMIGLIELKDTVKEGLPERFAEFRKMGIRTVM